MPDEGLILKALLVFPEIMIKDNDCPTSGWVAKIVPSDVPLAAN
jgi:hypothetical protein